jgi:hypothetical protein
MYHLAEVAAQVTFPNWSSLLIQPLHFVIYDLLGPFVYLLILLFGIELAIPGGTPVRALVRRTGAVSPVKIALANDPQTRMLSTVAVLFALTAWATVITAWLNKYFQVISAPQLADPTPTNALIFLTTIVIGLVAGDLWVTGVRSAQTARASLGVLAISMALSGTILFFYVVEPKLQDLLLSAALGIFTGELGAVARHPTLFHEGLFDVLRSPLESDLDEADETSDDMSDIVDEDRPTTTSAWLSTQTRAIRERLAAQKVLGVGAMPGEHPVSGTPGEPGQQRDANSQRPV